MKCRGVEFRFVWGWPKWRRGKHPDDIIVNEELVVLLISLIPAIGIVPFLAFCFAISDYKKAGLKANMVFGIFLLALSTLGNFFMYRFLLGF